MICPALGISQNHFVAIRYSCVPMYFPTSAARALSTVPALPNIPPEPIISLRPGPRKSLFCTLTRNGVTVWTVRVGISVFNCGYCLSYSCYRKPSAVLAFLSRTPTSIIDHGENVDVWWSPDGARIIIQVRPLRCLSQYIVEPHS